MSDLINSKRYKTTKLVDIAMIERATKGKEYPAGSILIQLSASNGQILYLDSVQQVETKYAVVTLRENYDSKYIFYALQNSMPEFIAKYQSDINLQYESLKYLQIFVHEDIETQKHIVALFEELEWEIKGEEKIIDKYKNVKKGYLDKIFC